MSIIHLNADVHQEAQELLPWFVLGTLNTQEEALVEEHLRTCSQCQADLDMQRKLQAVTPAAPQLDAAPDVNAAFARLRAQLPPQRQEARAPSLPERMQSHLQLRLKQWWMPWVIAAQTAALACLCVVVMQKQSEPAKYVGLGGTTQNSGDLVVMFKPQTSEADLRRILQAADARVVDGPTVTGAYLLHVADAERTQALGALRSDPAVTMAESLDAGVRQ